MTDVGHTPSRVQTALTGPVSASDTDLPVTSTAGFVAPCAVLIGHKDAWHDPLVDYVPEIAWVTSILDGTTLRCVLADRGISGTDVRSHDGTTGNLTVTAIFDQRHWERLRQVVDQVDSMPAGELAYAQVTATQTGITTETDLTGLAVTLTVPAGRRVRVTGSGTVRADGGTAMARGWIRRDGVALQRWVDTKTLDQDETFRAEASAVVTPTAGSHTYKLTLERAYGTGSAALVASSVLAASILVEDIGAA